MLPDYKPAAALTDEQRKELTATPTVRICVGTSTLELPLGTIFHLPLGLINHYSPFLRQHFASHSCAADVGIYHLQDGCPAHFRIIASYIVNGHAKYVSNIGLSMCLDGKALNEELMSEKPEVLAFCQSADDINGFIKLCDKFQINEAISAAMEAYTLVVRFGTLHNIFQVPGFDEDMPWGPLGRILEVKNEDTMNMIPEQLKNLMEKDLNPIAEEKKVLEAVVREGGKVAKKDYSDARDPKHAFQVKLEEVLKNV